MPVPVEEILKHHVYETAGIDRVSTRKYKMPIEIVEPDPTWPQQFETLKARIESALGSIGSTSTAPLAINHRGSTSIPDLPAKNVLDIDLVVPDVLNEAAFVPQLEAVGFQFLFREPNWYQHRFFCYDKPSVNLHVFGPDCAEVERHTIFREWLMAHEDDRELYASVKRKAAEQSRALGEKIMDYNYRKEYVIKEILERAFRSLGYIE